MMILQCNSLLERDLQDQLQIRIVMYSTNFYTVRTNGMEIIRDHKSELQIKVFELDDSSYRAKDKELTFYGMMRLMI